MPSKYPVMAPSEVIKRLEHKGFQRVSQKGSHCKFSDGNHVCIIPMHDEIAKGTLKSILMQANISLEDFIAIEI
jgi:predicted RNA binding protein YcfA (HicA-like mRNA interferase family)